MKPEKKVKKTSKQTNAADSTSHNSAEATGAITSKQELKTFLVSVRDRLREQSAAPIFALSALNNVMNHPSAPELFDGENKELGRDIFLTIRQSGLQVNTPPLLFGGEQPAIAAR